VDEAETEAEANSHEAETEAKIALIFIAKFYILTPFSPKAEIILTSISILTALCILLFAYPVATNCDCNT